MATRRRTAHATTRVVADNPLEGEQLLLDALFGKGVAPKRPRPAEPATKPQHYKVVSISLYTEDIDRLARLVRELKSRGHTKANKSQVIRSALAQLDLDAVPKEP